MGSSRLGFGKLKKRLYGFYPLTEVGIPLGTQLRSWSELNVKSYEKYRLDPYTRCRLITMNGIEIASILFSHQFARHTYDPETKKDVALTRRGEQQQQKGVNWVIRGDESAIEVTPGYEQVSIDLTTFVARSEPNPPRLGSEAYPASSCGQVPTHKDEHVTQAAAFNRPVPHRHAGSDRRA